MSRWIKVGLAVLLAFAELDAVGGVDTLPGGTMAPGYMRLDRVIEANEIGLARPRGISATSAGNLLVTGTAADGSPSVATVSTLGLVLGTAELPPAIAAGARIAYDAATNRVIYAEGSELVSAPASNGEVVGDSSMTSLPMATGLQIAGLAIDAAGQIHVLEAGSNQVHSGSLGSEVWNPARRIALSGVREPLRDLAITPDGQFLALGSTSGMLYEFGPTGTLLSTRDPSSEGISSPAGLVMAASGDTSDVATTQNLYLVDVGGADGTGAGVYEIALSPPAISETAASPAVTSATLIRTIKTGAGSTWNPDSPDPSGLAYIPASDTDVPASRRGKLVSADGEVEETTGAGWHDVNIWFAPRNGSVQTATFNTRVAPTNPTNNEPVGVAYDPARNELYVCKDGGSGRVWVYNAVTMAQVRSFTVTGAPYNNADAEGLAFRSGILYMVDALDNDLLKVKPGPNGIVGTGGDDVVTNYDLQRYGQTEPEGLDVHPATGNIWIVSNRVSGGGIPDPMIEVTPNGVLVSSVSIAGADPNSAGGLAIAPPSSGGPGWNFFVADRGVDNNDVPSENDGKIFEFHVP